MEAEQDLIESSMGNGNVILVVEAVTRVARAGSGMMMFVTEAVEDPLRRIQTQHLITSTKIAENVQ